MLAADYLNFNADHSRDADGLSETIIYVFSQLLPAQLLAQKMTLFSVKQHVAGTSLLGTVATLSQREGARSLHAQADSHREQVRQFLRNLKDDQLLVDAIAHGCAQHLVQPLPGDDIFRASQDFGSTAMEDIGSSFTFDAPRSLFGSSAGNTNPLHLHRNFPKVPVLDRRAAWWARTSLLAGRCSIKRALTTHPFWRRTHLILCEVFDHSWSSARNSERDLQEACVKSETPSKRQSTTPRHLSKLASSVPVPSYARQRSASAGHTEVINHVLPKP